MHSLPLARRLWAALVLSVLAAALPLSAVAQFDPARAYKQSEAVKKRYPDPPVRFETPGFAPGKADFTTHEEMMTFLHGLQRKAPGNLQLRVIGESEEGRSIPMLVLSNAGVFTAPEVLRLNRPVVLLAGLQHGNEPAGGEVMLALAQELTIGPLKPLLDRITVVIVPRSNPDGAFYFTRSPGRGIDINRDHIKLDLPDTIALHKVINEFQPEVFVDAHEFSVATRWVQKFGKLLAYDLTFLYATNLNVAPELTALADKRFRTAIVRDVEKAGYTQHWYFTTSYNMEDKKVSMGGTSPDIGRNTAGLQNSISFLIETRGVGMEAQIKNEALTLKANSFARGEIIISGDNPAMVVPVETIINFAGINKVFIVEDDKAVPREVKLGAIRDGQQEVVEGLKGGERVVIGGRTKVQPGSAVKVEAK